jgi:hypothetical protein
MLGRLTCGISGPAVSVGGFGKDGLDCLRCRYQRTDGALAGAESALVDVVGRLRFSVVEVGLSLSLFGLLMSLFGFLLGFFGLSLSHLGFSLSGCGLTVKLGSLG